MEHTIGEMVIDRWATFYVFQHKDVTYRCACQVLMNALMNDDEKMNDIRTRMDRYAFDGKMIASLLNRARKKGKMREVMEKSILHEAAEEGTMLSTKAKIIGSHGDSVLMELYAVTDRGIDCLQYFEKSEFQKRFRSE